MHIQYDNVWKKYKASAVKKLINRGFEEIEAIATLNILENLMEVRKPNIKLEALYELLQEGNRRMSVTGTTPGDHYGELKRMIKDLEQQKDDICQKSPQRQG